MAHYRIYCLDRAGQIGLAEWIEASNDRAAICVARDLRPDAQKCEIWLKDRLVAKLNMRAWFERVSPDRGFSGRMARNIVATDGAAMLDRALLLATECGSIEEVKRRLIREGCFQAKGYLRDRQTRQKISARLNLELSHSVPKPAPRTTWSNAHRNNDVSSI